MDYIVMLQFSPVHRQKQQRRLDKNTCCNIDASPWPKKSINLYGNKNPHFWRMIPELESRRNAWLEFFKTADDLGTDIFLSFKKAKAVFKH